MQYLNSRGITPETARRFGLGFNQFRSQYESPVADGKPHRFPRGIVIPNIRNGNLICIKVRRLDGDGSSSSRTPFHKYEVLSGCGGDRANAAYVIRTAERSGTPIIIVESELDAMLLAQEIPANLFNYIALGSAEHDADVEVAAMIDASSQVYFVPDYDDAGMAAYERWHARFPKIEQLLMPYGKDVTDSFLRGFDLGAWGKSLRGIGHAVEPVTREHRFSYRHLASHDDALHYLDNFRFNFDSVPPVLGIDYDRGTDLIGFSNGDTAAVACLSELNLNAQAWYCLLTGIQAIAAYDPVSLRRDIPALKQLIGSPLLLHHALTGKGKHISLDELSNIYLGHHAGDAPLDSNEQISDERRVAGNARAVSLLSRRMVPPAMRSDVINHYKDLKNAQTALAEIMRTGLPIDWDAFRDAGGSEKAKEILAHRDSDDRVRAHYDLCGTVTGRLTCTMPNLQAFPNDLKNCVKAPAGRKLVCADYRQSELRIAAELAKEPRMLNLFENGGDIHTATAKFVLGDPKQRKLAKTLNFGRLYDQTPQMAHNVLLEDSIDIPEKRLAAYFLKFDSTYSALSKYFADLSLRCKVGDKDITTFPNTGIRTASGRFIPIYTLDWPCESRIRNYLIQGSGADLMLRVLGMMPSRLDGLDCQIIHTVHDEILLEASDADADEALTRLTETMTTAFGRLFHTDRTAHLVDGGIGQTWAEAKG